MGGKRGGWKLRKKGIRSMTPQPKGHFRVEKSEGAQLGGEAARRKRKKKTEESR